ncbi:MAG: adenylate/guanylate cyclase domain-containing protein [Coleofasciculus sp. S288]|nr:adenylate/guanylate cyclase domain-containing protein [Coleofasciculus sp. S288]
MQTWAGIKELVVPVKQGLAFLKTSLSASWSTAYEVRRKSFLRNRLRLTLWLALALVLTLVIYQFSRATTTPDPSIRWGLVVEGVLGLCLLTTLALLKTPLGQHYPEILFLGFSWSTILVPQIGDALIRNVELSYQIWIMTFLVQATLMPVHWVLHLVSQLSAPAFYLGVNALFGLGLDEEVFNPILYLYLFWFCLICDISVFLYERLQREEFSARRELEVAYQKLTAERERAEQLLLNILPECIADRLKHGDGTIAEQFTEATVLFADIVGFTQLSSHISPTELVILLNQMFSMFDRLVEKHGVEKIKTIGDAYMAVSGLPIPCHNHAPAIANLALDMQEAVARFNIEYNQSFSIRIGINTGPVVAGVIGLKRFIYDLWGDTVNIASRMESHGVAGVIQVSEATYECLKRQYRFKKRGKIPVKGKGEMNTYFLLEKQNLPPVSSLSR